MKDEAYFKLHELESGHWWFVGARAVYRTLLKLGLKPGADKQRLIDIGSGSGGNLELISEFGVTVGVELSRLSLNMAAFVPELGLVQAKAEALPFANNCFDCVNLLGVIEHLDDDEAGLTEAARVCKITGVLILLTSALPILWSHHDEANLHKRRYFRRDLSSLLEQAGFTPIRLSYQNFFTFIPVLILRHWQKRKPQIQRYDMGSPNRFLNTILIWILKLEAFLIRFFSLPIGVDLVAVCRKINH